LQNNFFFGGEKATKPHFKSEIIGNGQMENCRRPLCRGIVAGRKNGKKQLL